MTSPIMFNRRLARNELSIWLDLLEQQTDSGLTNRDLAIKYLSLEETISYVTTIEDDIVGGTVIYRDRTRLGMILASVSVKEEYRDTGTFNIIKSSLPFFRTVAIRDVDALVPDSKAKNEVGFPYSLELDWWTRSILERIGFEEIEKVYSYTLSLKESKSKGNLKELWDPAYNADACRKFIWDSSKVIGLTNSYVWTAYDFAVSQGALKTITRNGTMRVLTSIGNTNDTAILDLLVVSPQDNELLKEILLELNVKKIIFPLVGAGQIQMLESISNDLGGNLKQRSMTLLRKHL